MNAFEKQVGGNHYKSMNPQPARYMYNMKLDGCLADIVKRISCYRFLDKDEGILELEKALHECDLLSEMSDLGGIGEGICRWLIALFSPYGPEYAESVCVQNNLSEAQTYIIKLACVCQRKFERHNELMMMRLAINGLLCNTLDSNEFMAYHQQEI